MNTKHPQSVYNALTQVHTYSVLTPLYKVQICSWTAVYAVVQDDILRLINFCNLNGIDTTHKTMVSTQDHPPRPRPRSDTPRPRPSKSGLDRP